MEFANKIAQICENLHQQHNINELAKANKALSVAEIAKAAKITAEEAYLGLGWLFKEGKVTNVEGGIALA